MGRDKATVIFKGRPLIAYVYDLIKDIFPNVFVLSSQHIAFKGVNAPIVKDFVPIKGSMVGIASALLAATTDYVFVVGCDMPFIRKDTIRYMVEQAHGEDIIVPWTKAGFEPLHALYNRSCLPHMLRAIDRDQLKISALFPTLSVRVVTEPSGPSGPSGPSLFVNKGVSIFTNINTEEDLTLAESRIG